MATTILAKRFWGTSPFSCFCMEFAANLVIHTHKHGLNKIIPPQQSPPPPPQTKLRSLTCARYVKGV